MPMRTLGALGLVLAMQVAAIAREPPMGSLRADQTAFRALYKELVETDGNGVHGLNQRRSVRALHVGRDFLTDLVKACADSD